MDSEQEQYKWNSTGDRVNGKVQCSAQNKTINLFKNCNGKMPAKAGK